jgi:hypothetical protein
MTELTVSRWGNAVYLHVADESGRDASIRLNANHIAALREIVPALRDVPDSGVGARVDRLS